MSTAQSAVSCASGVAVPAYAPALVVRRPA